MENIGTHLDNILDMIIKFAPKLALAVIILWVGLFIIKRLTRLVEVALKKSGLGDSVRPFISSLISISLKVLLIFSVAEIIGVETTSFVAVLAAAGFAIGLALQGSLGNFASGVIILVFRPYKTGDWIQIDDKFGMVEEIQIFNTIVETPGHKTLIIPNAQITDGIVSNYSKKGFIRLELNVYMPYEESFPKIKTIILDALQGTPKMLENPAPEVGIEMYASHSVQLAVRPYAKPDDFWEVTFEAHERIKAAFHEHRIKVAYSEGVELGKIGE